MIYTVKWGDDPDDAYHVEMTGNQKDQLHLRMEATDDIESFEIYPIQQTVNAYEDIIDTLEDLCDLAPWEGETDE